jgi:pantetheine-phosphate adenylyltransferase
MTDNKNESLLDVGDNAVQQWLEQHAHESRSHKVALYPGSFDPPTFGHLNLIERASKMFDELIVIIGVNPRKPSFIPMDVRLKLLRDITAHLPNVMVDTNSGLTVDYAKKAGVCAFVRGMRPAGDFEPEYILAMSNYDLAPNIETCWLATAPMYSHISSSLVREVFTLGKNNEWTKWVPNPVIQYLMPTEQVPQSE